MARIARFGSLAFLLALLAAGLAARTQAQPSGSGAKGLEDLLKEAKLEYSTIKPEGGGTFYKIPITIKDETAIIIAHEISITDEIKVARFFTFVTSMPENFKPSAALMKKVADLNYNMTMGTVGLGSSDITYGISQWLHGMDATAVGYCLGFAHLVRTQLKKELQPFLQEQ